MATKFILAGGYVRKAPDGGKAFCEESIRGFSEPIKILDCMFARFREVWEGNFLEDKEFFTKNLPGMHMELKLAGLDSFVEDVEWADLIFLRGGSSAQLVESLKERKDWLKHLEGKTVMGTSAGADALSKYYYGLDKLQIRGGLGLIEGKVIPHFRSDYHGWEFDWDKALSELENYKEKLPVYALPEGEFKVIER